MIDDVSTNVSVALHDFFTRFGIPAFLEDSIPEKMPDGDGGTVDTNPPYITYQLMIPEPLHTSILHARVWYRNTSAGPVLAKCGEIERAIGRGVTIPTEYGSVVIFKDSNTPFTQLQPMNDPNLKVAYLTMILHANTR
jgi:hypothetical protein